MGSLMSGWNSTVLDDARKVRRMRNRSLTKEEVDAFWRQHGRPDTSGHPVASRRGVPTSRSRRMIPAVRSKRTGRDQVAAVVSAGSRRGSPSSSHGRRPPAAILICP
ncbi:hypothetical protein PR202_gb10398 [Eleusine coracana subsp. coracana]|uniref:Uncharacterized protein n=1 Tax=Eleusine coracana subsp. coracana TaxID=191504 RepID=A0AAV5EHH4_ELECO|nr:hypothetical protein PR202_gb10398 [Eleusine coracana subsp. coracana]